MRDRWSSEMAVRLRPPLAAATAIAVVMAVGVAARSPEPSAAPAPAVSWPISTAEPAPTVPAACRPSPDDAVSEGVTGTAIRIASTVTLDGPEASLLAAAPVGMRAVVNRVNRAGGICGRRVELTTVNDSSDPRKSHAMLRRFLSEDYFALVAVPSTDGLVAALEHGDIDAAGIPVVGTGGMADAEFASPWVWPVGTSTAMTMRAIAHDAAARGARRFAVVRGGAQRFAHDGAAALRAEVQRLGGRMMAEIVVGPEDAQLADEARQFELACDRGGRRCDAVVLLLNPSAALAWRAANPAGTAGRARAGGLTYGARTLFTDDFARECAQWCDGLIVPTAYEPAVPPRDTTPAVAKFLQDVRAERRDIDARNQVVEQSYLGMAVFVQAALRCSPELTRSCLRRTLNTLTFTTGLTGPLRWRADHRHANTSANFYVIRTHRGFFAAWAPLR